MDRRFRVAAGVWVGTWLLLSCGALLDDALIYQRFAEVSRVSGFPTFDGVTRGYGPSSLLFFFILVGATYIASSVMVPQILSIFFFLACVALLAFFTSRREASPIVKVLGLLMLTPMAIRWLTNGMETSLAAFLCLGLGWVVGAADSPRRPPRLLVVAGLAWAILLSRPELLVVLISAGIAAGILGAQRSRPSFAIPGGIVLGAVSALFLTLFLVRSLVPDAAVAKEMARTDLLPALQALAATHGTAGSFGTGLVLLYAASAAAAFRTVRRPGDVAALSVALTPICIVLALTSARGQAIQGIRYFVPFYLFSIAFTASFLRSRTSLVLPRVLSRTAAISLALAVLVETGIVLEIQRSAATVVREMAAHDLGRLSRETGVAYDVGFISYFTRADICDASGLVNGPEHARATLPDRLRACAARNPRFAFATVAQAQTLAGHMDLTGWRACHAYTRKNAFSSHTHYLLLAPDLATRICGVSSSRIPSAGAR